MKKISIFILMLTVISCFSVSAQSWIWGKQNGDLLTSTCVATNATGNVYQAGTFGRITIGNTIINSNNVDVFIKKFDQGGNLLRVCYSVSAYDFDNSAFVLKVKGLATDDSEYSYVAGFAYKQNGTLPTDTLTFGSKKLGFTKNGEAFIVKYDPKGNVMWASIPDTSLLPDGTFAWGLAADNAGHAYLSGANGFLIKYDRNGKALWSIPQTSRYNSLTQGYSMAIDKGGNVYYTGEFSDTFQIGSTKLFTNEGDMFVAKFDSNGHALWAQQTHRYGIYAGLPALALDASGGIYLINTFNDTEKIGSHTFIPNGYGDGFYVMKFNPDGSIAWAKQTYNYTGWWVNSISTDASNHVYISGSETSVYTGSFVFANDTIANTRTRADNPSFVMELDSSGTVIANSFIDGGGYGKQNMITSSPSGNYIYMNGTPVDSFTIGHYHLYSSTSYLARWQAGTGCKLNIDVVPQTSVSCGGQPVNLYAEGGAYYDWAPTTYLSSSIGDNVVVTPGETTTYYVAGYDAQGCAGTNYAVVTYSQPPTVSINYTLNGTTASFKADTSADTLIHIVSYNWDFGDGTTGTGLSPVHVYANPGFYAACLTVANAAGCADTNCTYFSISPYTAKCWDSYKLYPASDIADLWYLAFDAVGKAPISYYWTWGDGTSSYGDSGIWHVYPQAGSYDICLTITDDTLCTSTFCDSSIYIYRTENNTPVTVIPFDVHGSIASGVKQILPDNNTLAVVPNPCFSCTVKGIENVKDMLVTDLLGRTVGASFTKSAYGYELNLPDSRTGFFIVKNMKTGDVVKFVRE